MEKERKIQVLIVDDSPTARNLLRMLISEDPKLEVTGVVADGAEALEFLKQKKPDVISMDIYMPGMNGFEATRQIMATDPLPIVIVSSAFHSGESHLSFQALEAGALTILARPPGPGHPDFIKTGKKYCTTLKLMSEVRVIRRHKNPGQPKQTPENNSPHNTPGFVSSNHFIVGIGASAGGPAALHSFLKDIPRDFPYPVLIVQHVDKGFSEGFREWLSNNSAIPVTTANEGELFLGGHAYLPPGDRHLGVTHEGFASVSSDPPEQGLRPAVSFLFRSIANVYGKKSACILLSGMGCDGAKELKALKNLGALTLVQNEESALVYGMPGEACRLGAANLIIPPEQMIQAIYHHLSSILR